MVHLDVKVFSWLFQELIINLISVLFFYTEMVQDIVNI